MKPKDIDPISIPLSDESYCFEVEYNPAAWTGTQANYDIHISMGILMEKGAAEKFSWANHDVLLKIADECLRMAAEIRSQEVDRG